MALQFRSGAIGVDGDFVICGDATDIQELFGSAGTEDGASISAWIYLDSYGDTNFGRIADKDGVSQHGWLFYVSNTPRLGFNHGYSTIEGSWTSATGSIGLGQLHHVVVTFDGTSASNNPIFYVDGVLSATTTIQTPAGTLDDDSGARMIIGQRLTWDRAFDGRIEDWRLYDRIITAAEVKEIFVSEGRDDVLYGLVRRFPMSPMVLDRAPNTPYKAHKSSIADDTASFQVEMPDDAVPIVDGDTLIAVIAAGGVNNTTPPNITTPTGWTQIMHVDAASAPTWPVVAVYKRTAASEPASYTWVSNQAAHPWGAIVVNMGKLTMTEQDTLSATGTSASPSSPSATPGANAIIMRVCIVDDELEKPTIQGDFLPATIEHGLEVVSAGNGSENGYVLGVALETNDGTATGTQTWNPNSSEQWAALTLSWLHGDGQETLPVQDISPAQAHARTWGHIVGANGIVSVEGA